MNIREALFALGVRTDSLSDAEAKALDRDGFVPLYNVLTPERVRRFAQRIDALTVLEGAEAGKEVHQEKGTNRLADLVNKDPIFEICFTHPRVLAAVAHVLQGEFKLSSLNSRAALPGEGLQGLHADWNGAVTPGDFCVCNSLWLLDDFTEENGATRVVPGSHNSGKAPQDEMPDRSATHTHEVKLIAPAGTVVIFNAHAWHGGTRNESERPRRALHSYFCRRDQPQQLDQRKYIRPDTYNRLSAAARYILDV
jgi:ectoine hydroxylase-related dioxygenase (phytanoyl-CoA dioxygenase family)